MQFLQIAGIPDQEVKPRLHPLHPVDEEEEVDTTLLRHQIERCGASTGKGLVQHGEKELTGEEGAAVKGERASPLADDPGRGNAGNLLFQILRLRAAGRGVRRETQKEGARKGHRGIETCLPGRVKDSDSLSLITSSSFVFSVAIYC
ncbi:hypothetical protein [Geobacter sp.]|uniref:hypothetical protein n=1 Tax=Geobacter sp. TaxID=46610 RepID=UPI003457B870